MVATPALTSTDRLNGRDIAPAAAAPATPAPTRFTLTREQLAAALEGRPAEQVATIEWFRAHCAVHGLSWEKAGAKLHKGSGSAYSGNSVMQVMLGHRDLSVSLDPFCEAIARYRRHVEAPAPEGGFLETQLFCEIRTYVERARSLWKVGFVIGQNAAGKTTAVQQIERADHRVTVARMPEGGHLSAFLQEMARKLGLGDRQTVRDLSARIIAEFSAGDVLVIDEADECFRARSPLLGSKTLAFIRRLFDEARCAVVLVMDPAGFSRLRKVEPSDPLRRLYSRRAAPLHLPPFFAEDLDLFARQYQLPPAPDQEITVRFRSAEGKEIEHTDNPRRVQNAICGSHREGLFVWLGLLREAADLARSQRKDISWAAVLKTHALFAAMESEATV